MPLSNVKIRATFLPRVGDIGKTFVGPQCKSVHSLDELDLQLQYQCVHVDDAKQCTFT